MRQELVKKLASSISGSISVAGFSELKAELKEVDKLSKSIGKGLFGGSEKELGKVQERVAEIGSELFGIINPLKTSDSYVQKLAEDLEAAGIASETGMSRTIRSVETAAQSITEIDQKLRILRQEQEALGQQPLMPRHLTGRAEPTRLEYLNAVMLVELEKTKGLTKEQQAALERTASDLERMRVIYNEMEALKEKRIKLQQDIAKKTSQKQPITLPEDAKGTLADLVRAEMALGQAVQDSLKPISSQTSRFGGNMKRLKELLPIVKKMGESERNLVRILAATDERINTEMQQLAATVKAQNPFQWMTAQAQKAYDKIVGHSIIPDMVTGIMSWLKRLQTAQMGAFDPLEKEAQETSQAVIAQFRAMYQQGAALTSKQMSAATGYTPAQLSGMVKSGQLTGTQQRYRGPWMYPAAEAERLYQQGMLGPGSSQLRNMGAQMAANRRLEAEQAQFQAELAASRQPAAGAVPSGILGKAQAFGQAYYEEEMKRYANERIGRGLQMTGRSMMFTGAAVTGGLTLSAKNYLDYNREMERSARNLDLNAELTKKLNTELKQTSLETGLFSPKELAEGLYFWASGTGEVVKSEQDLNRVMGQTTDIQKLAYMNMSDLGETTKFTGSIMGEFGLKVGDTRRVVEVLNYSAARSFAEVDDMGEAFKMVGPVAKSMNVSLEDTAVMLQALADKGLRGSMAGRALRQMFIQLADPSKEAQESLAQLFGGTWHEQLFAGGQFVGTTKFIEMLSKATRGMTEAQKNQALASMATANELPALIALVDEQTKAQERGINVLRAREKLMSGVEDSETRAYQKFVEQEYGKTVAAEGATALWSQMWQRAEDSDAQRADRIKRRWETAMLNIGQAAFQTSVPFLETVSSAVKTIGDVAARYPGLVSAAGVMGTGLFTVGFITKTVGDVVIAANTIASIAGAGKDVFGAGTQMAAADTQMLAAETQLRAAGINSSGGGATGAAGGGILTALGKMAGVAGAAYVGYEGARALGYKGDMIDALADIEKTALQQTLIPVALLGTALKDTGIISGSTANDLGQLIAEVGSLGAAGSDTSGKLRDMSERRKGMLARAGSATERGDFVPGMELMGVSTAASLTEQQEEILDAWQSYLDDREEMVTSYNDRLADIEKDFNQSMTDFEADYQRDRAKLLADTGLDIEKKRVDTEQKIAKAIEDSRDKEAQAEEDYQKKVRDIQERYHDTMADAVLKRDARAVFQAQRERDRSLRDAQEERAEKISDIQSEREERITELQTTFESERIERQADNELKIAELDAQHEQEREKRITAYNEQRNDLVTGHQKELEAYDKAGRNKLAIVLGWGDREREARKRNYDAMLVDAQAFVAQEQAILGGARYTTPASTKYYAGAGFNYFAEGGYAGRGLAMLGEDGRREFVLNANTTRALERSIGPLTQEKFLRLGGRSEHLIRFEGVPAGISQSGLERAVQEVMARDIKDYLASRN